VYQCALLTGLHPERVSVHAYAVYSTQTEKPGRFTGRSSDAVILALSGHPSGYRARYQTLPISLDAGVFSAGVFSTVLQHFRGGTYPLVGSMHTEVYLT